MSVDCTGGRGEGGGGMRERVFWGGGGGATTQAVWAALTHASLSPQVS